MTLSQQFKNAFFFHILPSLNVENVFQSMTRLNKLKLVLLLTQNSAHTTNEPK